MFDTVVSKLVKSIGSDLYIPSASVASAQNICPLTLVERKASKWWLGSNTYSVTDFVLSDVVSDGDPLKIEINAERDLAAFNKSSTVKVNGSLSGHFKSLFNAELDSVDTITIKANLGELHSVEVSEQSLLDNLSGRRLNLNHELVKELMAKKRRALCVVVGLVKTTTPTTIEATLNLDFKTDDKVSIPVTDVAGGEIKADVDDDKARSISLPAGTVLAYQVVELSVSDKGDLRVMVSQGSKGGFHAKVDIVDAPNSNSLTAAGPTAAANMVVAVPTDQELHEHFSGFSSLPSETSTLLAEKILKVSNADSLRELSALLYSAASVTEDKAIQEVLDALSGYRNDCEVTKAMHLLCRILRNLDSESLSSLSCVPVTQLPALHEVLKATHIDRHLQFSDSRVQVILSAPESLKFLLCGLEYTLDNQRLRAPATYSQHLLDSAYAAVYGLYTCFTC